MAKRKRVPVTEEQVQRARIAALHAVQAAMREGTSARYILDVVFGELYASARVRGALNRLRVEAELDIVQGAMRSLHALERYTDAWSHTAERWARPRRKKRR